MKLLEFVRVKKETNSIDLLEKIGYLGVNSSGEEIKTFRFNGINYPIEKIAVRRYEDGYGVFCLKRIGQIPFI